MFSIIIPHYRNLELLDQCLESVLTSLEYAGIKDSEIIVIDNAATKKSKSYLNNFAMVTPIFNSQNLGFAKAINQGVKQAKGDYCVVLNNDLTLDRKWFKYIDISINKHRNSTIAVFYGPVLNKNKDKIESLGLEFYPQGKAVNIKNNNPFYGQDFKSKIIWGAPASAVVYSKKALESVGYFSDYFFAYLEDVDLNLKLKASGYQTILVPKAISFHQGGATADLWPDFRQRMTARNWWYIIITRYPVTTIIKYLFKILFEQFKVFWGIKSWKKKLWTINQIIRKLPTLLRKRKPIPIISNFDLNN